MEIKKEEYKESLNEDYLGIHEAAQILEVSEEELRALIKRHEIPIHNVAGAFTRLKRGEMEILKNKWRIERELFPAPEKYFSHNATVRKATFFEKVADFWYFNDFYVACSIIIAALVYFILAS